LFSSEEKLQRAIEATIAAGYQLNSEAFEFLCQNSQCTDPETIMSLALQQIDALQDTLDIEPANIENLLRSCIERINGIAISLGKTINLHIDNTEAIINIDEEKFSRALLNILANSLRYAEHSVDISFTAANNSSVIEIVDDGRGFNEEDIPKVFDRFYKGKGGKYGLGLAITKTIIEKHNGSITAGNYPQRGAYFKIIL
jgi:signal transduction histidine kinase